MIRKSHHPEVIKLRLMQQPQHNCAITTRAKRKQAYTSGRWKKKRNINLALSLRSKKAKCVCDPSDTQAIKTHDARKEIKYKLLFIEIFRFILLPWTPPRKKKIYIYQILNCGRAGNSTMTLLSVDASTQKNIYLYIKLAERCLASGAS